MGKRHPHGWILYTEPESIRNRHYIDLYRKACQKYGMSIELVLDLYKLEFENPDFVINRTRDYQIGKLLEARGIPVYNHSCITELGNDKAKGYRYMEAQGIEIMPVIYQVEAPPDTFPVIIKACSGHGGTEVFFIRDAAAWQQWKETEYQPQKAYIQQQPSSDLGRDVRVYVVGNQIVAAVLRTSETDFRSNYSLGGKVSLYTFTEKEEKQVKKAMSCFDIGMAGIDFIFHHGRLVFNELEDMAGARMLYALSDIDIVEQYVRWIYGLPVKTLYTSNTTA